MSLLQKTNPSRPPATVNEWDPFRMMRELMPWQNPFVALERRRDRLYPEFDIKETTEGYSVKADLPGVDETDVEVTLHGSQLKVSGRRQAEQEETGDTWFSVERSYGMFTRMFTLPEGADADRARADLENGVLHVFVPRKADARSTRVAIKSDAKK